MDTHVSHSPSATPQPPPPRRQSDLFETFLTKKTTETTGALGGSLPVAAAIAEDILAGVIGIEISVTPSGLSASTTAFTARIGEIATPASPTAFAPSGLVEVGTGLSSHTNSGAGMSPALGKP